MSPERRRVSRTLRTGVFASFLLLTAGLARALFEEPAARLHPSGVAELPQALLALDAGALIHAGLLVLMLTPFLRIVVLTIHFARTGERPFVLVTIGVICLLIGTVALGLL